MSYAGPQFSVVPMARDQRGLGKPWLACTRSSCYSMDFIVYFDPVTVEIRHVEGVK